MKSRSPITALKFSLLSLLGILAGSAGAQQVYDTFESPGVVSYTTTRTAKLDTLATNPSSDDVNASDRCASFKRSRQRFDYVKLYTDGRMSNVENYASYDPSAPRLKMKVYTSAPVGTLIEIQLGKRKGIAYPDGTHSQYQARTTTRDAWEELEFSFVVSPRGSRTSADEVDQVTLLFNPNSATQDTFYFDDLTGPEIVPVKVPEKQVRLWKKR